MAAGLNPKQKAFCREFIKDSNGTQAAIRAGYSAKTASVKASTLLSIVKVQAEIKRLLAPVEEAAALDATRLCKEISRLAHSNIQRLYDERGEFVPIHKLPPEVAACISGIDYDDGMVLNAAGEMVPCRYIKKIRLWDKNKAQDLAARILKLLKEDEGKDSGDLPDILAYLKGASA